MRILIAEDEVEIARALKVLLEKNKCAVDIVHNGKDAWDFVSQGHYDVFAKNNNCPYKIYKNWIFITAQYSCMLSDK